MNHQRLLELLDYDAVTGVFTRKISLSNRSPIGSVAGSIAKGYCFICVDGKRYAAHRLAWFYIHGSWPTDLLDHDNTNGIHNAISNLRLANKSTNGANRGLNKNNTTGFKGVSVKRNRFISRIKVNKTHIHLGCFLESKDAAQAYDFAAVQHFGQFALTNKSLGLI
jgi:hypothetical protein